MGVASSGRPLDRAPAKGLSTQDLWVRFHKTPNSDADRNGGPICDSDNTPKPMELRTTKVGGSIAEGVGHLVNPSASDESTFALRSSIGPGVLSDSHTLKVKSSEPGGAHSHEQPARRLLRQVRATKLLQCATELGRDGLALVLDGQGVLVGDGGARGDLVVAPQVRLIGGAQLAPGARDRLAVVLDALPERLALNWCVGVCVLCVCG